MKKRDTAWVFKTLLIMAVACTLLGGLSAGAVFWYFSRDLPKIITVADYKPLTVTRILAAPDADTPTGGPSQTPTPATPTGKAAEAPLEPAVQDDDLVLGEFYKERRYVVPYEKIPEVVVRAFISAEDDKFFEHMGVNLTSILRAGIANMRAGHVVQGGSTITQQVAKSLLLTPERSFTRKIKEIILSSRIERNLSKQQILYLYLNQIYLGHGAYGVQAAARTYFRKDVSQLTVAESAVLAGLPQAPTKYSPIVSPKKAKERQLYVLRRMYENRFISQGQHTEAAAQPLKVFHDEDINLKYAPYLVEHVRRYLLEKYGEKGVYEEGLTVRVPTSRRLALAAGKSLKDGLALVDKRVGYRGPLQKLVKPADIEKFLIDERIKLIERRLHYQVLLPDGRMDPIAAMQVGGIQSDLGLLEPGERYRAVVTSNDDKRKVTGVMIGAIKAEMPFDLVRKKWGKLAKDDPTGAPGKEPTVPSRAFAKGDVILVKLSDEPARDASGVPTVVLEQEPTVQGALVSIEARTGNLLALEGGYDFEASEFNRATQAQRQSGSAFKPIVYSEGLEKGFSPATIIVDSPIVYEDTEIGKWKPSNFEEKFYGDTTFRQALIKSRNIPTIKIAKALGVQSILAYTKRLGMEGKFPPDLSISLGSASVSLLEMTKTYALFPRLGRKVNPIFISRVLDRDGKELEAAKPQLIPEQIHIAPASTPAPTAQPSGAPAASASGDLVSMLGKSGIPMPEYPLANDPDQVLDPRVAYVMTHLMKEVVNYGTGHDAKALNRIAAGKTGTTSDYVDAWFMGFTPHVVTGVWVGFDNQKSIGKNETGAKASLPIWLGFMREAVKNYPDTDFTLPPGVVFASIDPDTGKLAPANASQAIKEAFIEGTQPLETSTDSGSAHESQSEFFKEDIE